VNIPILSIKKNKDILATLDKQVEILEDIIDIFKLPIELIGDDNDGGT
jgi:hypothetical protein